MDSINIWTVVILGRDSEELSTVSFKEFDSAVDYVMSELENSDEDTSAVTRRWIESDMYFRGMNATYWIEETKLF
jgi:hypothetical protein